MPDDSPRRSVRRASDLVQTPQATGASLESQPAGSAQHFSRHADISLSIQADETIFGVTPPVMIFRRGRNLAGGDRRSAFA
jgi:hypothetical protein